MSEPTSTWLAEACASAEGDEQACLGAALGNCEAARVVACELESDQFARDSHQRIHAAIAALVARGEGVDVLTVGAEVERTSGWEGTRSRDYLHVLAESTPAAAHARQYCARVAELARQRDLRRYLQRAWTTADDLVLTAAARERLHAEVEAIAGLLEGATAGGEDLPLYDGPELAAMRLDEPQPICTGLIYRGCSTDLVAEPKRGKTTLLLDVAAAVTAGEPWCQRATAPSGVLYLSEQSPHSFSPQCARAGLLGERRFVVLFHRDALGLSWSEIGDRVLRVAEGRDLAVVVVDNLSLWAGIAGEEENDAGVALETLRVIERLTGAGLGVVSVRHARKSGGTIHEAGRGSSAIAGGFDILAQLRGDVRPRRRTLATTGRIFPEEPLPLVIELGSDGHYRYVGEGAAVLRGNAREFLLGLLPQSPDEALAEAAILAAARDEGIGKSVVQEELRRLCADSDPERLVERAKGVGGLSAQAYGYWRRGDAI